MPCSPARMPVPSEVRLVAVVEGTPHTMSSMPGRADKNGAHAAFSRSSDVPRPSMTITTNRGASGRPRPSVKPGTPSAPPTDGSSSSSVCRPIGPYDDALGSVGAIKREPSGVVGGGGRGQRAGEVEEPAYGLAAVGRRAQPKREVVAGEVAGVAVVGVALRVVAGRRLDVDARDSTP